MEEREFSDIHGRRVILQQEAFTPSCREFSLSCPKLSFRSLTTCTSAVWLSAYAVFTVTENTMVLTAAIFITLVSLIVYLHFVKIDQESLLVIGSLGIQMTSTFASGKECTSFIEMHRVKDIVINEAIFMQKSSQPRLDCLVEVYRSCQDIISKKNTTVDVAE